jgi:phosphotriesterase-related protein
MMSGSNMSARTSVWTTEGLINVDELGTTLVHEHIMVMPPGAELDPTAKYSRADAIARAVDALGELQDFGVRTIIDPCPINQGRDVEMLAEVARRTSLNLICATGFYLEEEGRGVPFYWRMRSVEEICELYVSELEKGIGDTGIRAGVIKAASGDVVGRHDEKTLRAAGMASAATDVSVITHTEHSRHGDVQQELLQKGGASLSRCLIGHLDTLTVEELLNLAMAGSMVSVDRIGWDILGDESHRLDLVVAMFEAGLEKQLCISQDRVATYWSPRPQFFVPDRHSDYVKNIRRPALLRDGTTKGYAYLFTSFVPELLNRGLTKENIQTLLVENPRRFLSGSGDFAS